MELKLHFMEHDIWKMLGIAQHLSDVAYIWKVKAFSFHLSDVVYTWKVRPKGLTFQVYIPGMVAKATIPGICYTFQGNGLKPISLKCV